MYKSSQPVFHTPDPWPTVPSRAARCHNLCSATLLAMFKSHGRLSLFFVGEEYGEKGCGVVSIRSEGREGVGGAFLWSCSVPLKMLHLAILAKSREETPEEAMQVNNDKRLSMQYEAMLADGLVDSICCLSFLIQ